MHLVSRSNLKMDIFGLDLVLAFLCFVKMCLSILIVLNTPNEFLG